MIDLKKIRNHLKLVQESEDCGLRAMQELTGVSFSSLSRFMRGAAPSRPVLRKLTNFYNGQLFKDIKPKVVKRFNLGTKTFIVEIRELEEK